MLARADLAVCVARRKEDDSVLRISSATEAGSLVTLKAEGSISGNWVPLLEAECLCHLEARKSVELDLAGVSFVDRDGVAMMRALVARGVQVVGASALVTALLEGSAAP
jgi:anti-anti-sigma regulatory factor